MSTCIHNKKNVQVKAMVVQKRKKGMLSIIDTFSPWNTGHMDNKRRKRSKVLSPRPAVCLAARVDWWYSRHRWHCRDLRHPATASCRVGVAYVSGELEVRVIDQKCLTLLLHLFSGVVPLWRLPLGVDSALGDGGEVANVADGRAHAMHGIDRSSLVRFRGNAARG